MLYEGSSLSLCNMGTAKRKKRKMLDWTWVFFAGFGTECVRLVQYKTDADRCRQMQTDRCNRRNRRQSGWTLLPHLGTELNPNLGPPSAVPSYLCLFPTIDQLSPSAVLPFSLGSKWKNGRPNGDIDKQSTKIGMLVTDTSTIYKYFGGNPFQTRVNDVTKDWSIGDPIGCLGAQSWACSSRWIRPIGLTPWEPVYRRDILSPVHFFF